MLNLKNNCVLRQPSDEHPLPQYRQTPPQLVWPQPKGTEEKDTKFNTLD